MTALSLEAALARGDAIQVDPIVLTQLEAVVGKRNVATGIADLICYAHDIMPPSFKWVRRDDVPYLPQMVVYPGSTRDVQEIVGIAAYNRIPVIPAGGTSGTIGGILAVCGGIVVDMKRMNKLLEVDEYSLTATAQAGMLGQDYEDQLNMRGFIGGHYPQSIRCSTVGGWIAPRGVGTFSSKYGKIEDIVQSLEIVLADGSVARTKNAPRASCGPDLDQLFIGSEGTLGIITEATLRIWPAPKRREWVSYGMPTFEAGVRASRDILAAGVAPAVMRLYDNVEIAGAYRELGYGDAAGVEHGLYLGCEGREDLVELEVKIAHEVCKGHGGVLRPGLGERWWDKRYDTTYLKKAYMLPNGIGDAIECASIYRSLTPMHDAMVAAIKEAGAAEVFGHGSHFYPTGGNLYVIWSAFAEDEREIEGKYWRIMDAAMKAVLSVDGSIGHHHGIGVNKGPWIHLDAPTAWPVVRKIKAALDPSGILNPGKLGL
ncbi:MAG: FAD-binding oxidoreductase [Isosphaeraceae bacterium]|jgi:alkyldihydroxyacetonephosphate synthase